MQPTGNVELLIYDAEKSLLSPIFEENDADFVMEWSPDSRHLAVIPNRRPNQLKILSSDTFEFEAPLKNIGVNSDARLTGRPVWSADSQWLAFVTETRILWFWDGITFFPYTLEDDSRIFNTRPFWLPQDNRVAVSFSESEGEQNGWLLIDPVSMTTETFYTMMQPSNPAVWSPDGTWLLFYAFQENEHGYFALNVRTGETFPVYDAAGLWEFEGLTWLSE